MRRYDDRKTRTEGEWREGEGGESEGRAWRRERRREEERGGEEESECCCVESSMLTITQGIEAIMHSAG